MPEVLPINSDVDYANITVNSVRQPLPAWMALMNPLPLGIATLGTVGAGTITGAQMGGRAILRSGPTANFTDTFDTSANLAAAISSLFPASGVWELTIANYTAWTQTLQAGTGGAIAGIGSVIPAGATAKMLVQVSSAASYTVTVLSVTYNAANGYDPSLVQTQFGSGTATFLEEGNLYRLVSGAGVSPGSTANDNVLAVYSMPANSFDQANRGVTITAAGSFGATSNSKTLKIIFNATTAVVGSAVTGGTTIASTGVQTQSGGGWDISGNVFKYGATNSNTQLCTSNGSMGTTHFGTTAPVLATAVENATILIAVCGNAATATTDIVLNWVEINAMN